MEFWNSRQQQPDTSDGGSASSEPTFLQNLADYAKEEAMAKVVETMTGGWITMEYEDEDEDQPRQRGQDADAGSFEERLQRRLAELAAQGSAPQADGPETPRQHAPVPPAPVPAPAPRPAARPVPHRAQGFGRKGL